MINFWRVVLDSGLATPPSARLFDAAAPVLLVTALQQPAREAALRERGAELLQCPGPGGRVDLAALWAELARRGFNELHVEAGARLNGALLQGGWADELLIYQAPVLLGSGRGMADLGPYTDLAQAQRFELHRVDRIGADLRLLARRPAAAAA